MHILFNYLGISYGSIILTLFFINGFCLYIGSLLVEYKLSNELEDRNTNLFDVIIVFFGLLIAGLVLSQINPLINMIGKARQAGGKIFQIIDEMQIINLQDKQGKEIKNFKGDIQFDNVSFKYLVNNQSYQSIQNVSLQIKAGQKISIIGQSGSGKSSLVNMIMRFYDPQEGSILLDGENLKDINVKWLRSQIGYVGQEPELFYGSIRQNLLIAKSDASEEELNQVLEKSLDKQIDSDVKNLSAGEKQRLCIARILLDKPKIFIFDEPTSSQDFRMEKLMQSLIDEITKGYTTIIVSHSYSNIQISDQIIVLSNGKIIKQGKHEDLIKEEGIYLNIIEEHQYIDQKIKDYMNNQIDEEVNEDEEESKQQNNDIIKLKRIKSEQQVIQLQQQKLKQQKYEQQQKQLLALQKRIKEKIRDQFFNLDFKQKNKKLPKEQFLFNFNQYKTIDEYKQSQIKQRRITNILNNDKNKQRNQIIHQKSLTIMKDENKQSNKVQRNLTKQNTLPSKLINLNQLNNTFLCDQEDKLNQYDKDDKQIQNFIQNYRRKGHRKSTKESDGFSNNSQYIIESNYKDNILNFYKSQPNLKQNHNIAKQNSINQQQQQDQILINYQNPFKTKKWKTKLLSILYQSVSYKDVLLYFAGLLMCILNGAIYPINSIVIANTLLAISDFHQDPSDINKSDISSNVINFIYTGVIGFVTASIMMYTFIKSGETLCFNLKRIIFKKLLHLPIQWFLKKENKLGVLSEIQNIDTQKVCNILGVRLSQQIQNISSIITALIISFHYNWRLALVILILFPIALLAGYFIKRNNTNSRSEQEIIDHTANQYIQDAIMNHKTLASLVNGHEYLQKKYADLFSKQTQGLKSKAKKDAFFYGLAMFIIVSSQSWFFFIVSEISFQKYDIRDLFVCIFSILFSIFSIMENLRYISDFEGATSSRKRIIQLLFKNKNEDDIHEEIKKVYLQNISKKKELSPDRQDQDQTIPQNCRQSQNESMKYSNMIQSNEKADMTNQNMMSLNVSQYDQRNQNEENINNESEAMIEFKSVYFKYPNRENYSLYNVNFKIKKGERVSLIGGSGSGKSTIFQLILGFFENYQGNIYLNGRNIRTMDLKEIRSINRWMQQDPLVIQESLQENIIFGSNSNSFNFKRYKQSLGASCCEDILLKMKGQYDQEQAFIKQSRQDFNSSLMNLKRENGQNLRKSDQMREAGSIKTNSLLQRSQDEFIEQTMAYKLQELSSGQKQKICLARAIYGQGMIYLFDHATSSIDLKTEKQIFKHFKSKYFQNKTFFQIAQRLQPILFSNKLMIINSGRLIEFKKIDSHKNKDSKKNKEYIPNDYYKCRALKRIEES